MLKKPSPGEIACASFLSVTKPGTIFLVGAGPGAPGLLTLRAKQIIDSADVIMYDDLLDPAILAGSKAELIYSGKRKGRHALEQNDIQERMYALALAGKNVCRLKGGDPFVFGRGGEELAFFESHDISVEIVPGITAAFAAAASAGIALTQREVASTVAFCTGHPVNAIEVPDADTLVYYMGASVLTAIAKRVVEKGRSPNTPVAIIRDATLPTQHVNITSLKDITDESIISASPAIIIIGEVVNNARQQPVVLFTGTDPTMCHLKAQLIHQPLIAIAPVSDRKDQATMKKMIKQVREFDWIIFTSKYTVDYFFEALMMQELDVRTMAGISLASIGATTSAYLKRRGIVADLQPENESSTGIIEAFKLRRLPAQRILIPRSDKALTVLPEGLTRLGHQVETVIVYNNIMPAGLEPLDLSAFEGIVFTSPTTVTNFVVLYGSFPSGRTFYVQGEETEKELRKWVDGDQIERLNR